MSLEDYRKLSKSDRIREERIMKQIDFMKEIVGRIDRQMEIALVIADAINRKHVPGGNRLISSTTGNYKENQKLVNSLKRLLLEINDPIKPYPKLIELFLTDYLINIPDALSGHYGNWEKILMHNAVKTMESTSVVTGRVRKFINKLKDKIVID